MGRTELTLLIGSALFVAVIIGWTIHWFYERMRPAGPVASEEATARMRAAEAAQIAAEEQLEALQREARNTQSQLQAELEAAMAGLGNARREAESWHQEADAWRAEVEELRQKHGA